MRGDREEAWSAVGRQLAAAELRLGTPTPAGPAGWAERAGLGRLPGTGWSGVLSFLAGIGAAAPAAPRPRRGPPSPGGEDLRERLGRAEARATAAEGRLTEIRQDAEARVRMAEARAEVAEARAAAAEQWLRHIAAAVERVVRRTGPPARTARTEATARGASGDDGSEQA
ncbi:hypothetical protein [Methylobacterium sp. JK268]